jgi:molecular chaperone DnaK (HSP70)
MTETIIGIDLGTTNSEVAIVQGGQVVVIEDIAGQKILPSFVSIGENNEILVGEPARNQYILYPERTIKSVKRKMGEDIKLEMGDQSYSPQEISAIILKRLKNIAEDYLKQTVHKAVITVPAYFSDAQRQATREAGEIAGLDVVRVINEPTAAALVYEANQKEHKRVLVYDLGGGTFDVSVVSIEEDVVEVVASHGNNHLGGDDFDQKIVEYILKHLKEKQNVDIEDTRKAMARINRASETAKRTLSDQPYVTIEEEYLTEHEGTPVNLSLELGRHEYEAMISSYIEETLESVHTALEDAKLVATDIDEIILVGGSTRTPLVGQRLKEEFGLTPKSGIDPDLCVAMGAAMQAARIAGDTVSSVLVDITPYTFGTSAVGELGGGFYPYVYIPIIKKNTPIPTSKTEVVYTLRDNQEQVKVDIYQGEDQDAIKNIQIGEFMIPGLSKVPEGNPILINLALDINGILNVTAKEKISGLAKSITINHALTSRMEEASISESKERISGLFGEEASSEQEQETDERIEKAQALIVKAEDFLKKEISSEDREDIAHAVETIKDALNKEDFATLETTTNKLSDILYYLES